METHHHQHTERKKWNHYVWEFLMLFLAVFAGFIAENLRENYTERKREHDYIVSLVDDLKTDTTYLSGMARKDLKMSRGQDSLIDLLNDIKDTAGINRKAYRYFFLYTTNFLEVQFSQKTISQLLNAGNMRLIEKHGISDSIMEYNLFTHSVEEQGKAYEEYFKKTLDQSLGIFDFSIARVELTDDYKLLPTMGKVNPNLLTSDPSIYKKYVIGLSLSKGILLAYIQSLVQVKEKAIALIKLLKKNYQLSE